MSYTLHCGDNVEWLKQQKTGIVQLTVTSPPYDNLRNYNGFSWDCEKLIDQLWWITRPGGVVVWVVADATINGCETGTSFKQALAFIKRGFNLHDTMIYAKSSYMPKTHNRYEQAFEYMFVFSKGKPSVFNPLMVPCVTAGSKRNRGAAKHNEASYAERAREESTTVNEYKQHPNVFFYDVGKNDKTIHNAPFPEQLAADQIASWSNTTDLVLDPFLGSGTTGKMAVLAGRNFMGCDISQEYVDLARKRIEVAL